MASSQRQKFNTTQNWHDFLLEIQKKKANINLFDLRKACYKDIEKYRKNPLLVYATKFLGQVPPGIPNFIDVEDVDGFTDMVNSVGKDVKEIDVLVHSP
ncbi:hypothetical protein GF340_04230, partial [Candidatus Peregrinibacteria bacterium]|nr:hypothetical protein [Candidatus Peregrinibacteria bacterium]